MIKLKKNNVTQMLTYEDEVGLDLEVCSIVERIPFQQTGDLVTYPWPLLYQHFYHNTWKFFTILENKRRV